MMDGAFSSSHVANRVSIRDSVRNPRKESCTALGLGLIGGSWLYGGSLVRPCPSPKRAIPRGPFTLRVAGGAVYSSAR